MSGAALAAGVVLVAAGLEATVPSSAGGPLRLEDLASHVSITVRLLGATDHTRVRYVRTPTGIEDFVWIDHAPASGELARLSIELGEHEALRLVDDALEVVDATGTPRLRAGRPWLRDADGRRHRVATRIEDCSFDADPRGPWDRPVVPPRARRCVLVLALQKGSAPRWPAELDPAWTTGATMSAARVVPNAAPVGASGRLLLAGGRDDDGLLDSAELFDPATGTFAVTAALPGAEARTAPLVAFDGPAGPRVLMAGGCVEALEDACATDTALVYEAPTGQWTTLTAKLGAPRRDHAAVRVGGRVLLVGGAGEAVGPALATTEVFDVASATFAQGPPLSGPRFEFGSAAVGDGVVIVGGRSRSDTQIDSLAVAERYDPPPIDAWSLLPSLPITVRLPSIVALPTGEVVSIGGYDIFTPTTSAFVLSSSGDAWTELPELTAPRARAAAALLPNGWLGVAGGYDCATTELLDVRAGAPSRWVSAPLLPGTRWSAASSTSQGSWSLVGGWAGTTATVHADAIALSLDVDGETCASGGGCLSGHCADGVCCDEACDTACSECSTGKCLPVATGAIDPHGVCVDEGACGHDGRCGAAGECLLHVFGDPCACDAGSAGTCDGAGTCGCAGPVCADSTTVRNLDGTLTSCAPFRCNGSACLDACTTSDECMGGTVCDRDRRCIPAPPVVTDEGCGIRGERSGDAWGLSLAGLLLTCAALRARRRA